MESTVAIVHINFDTEIPLQGVYLTEVFADVYNDMFILSFITSIV